MAKETGTFVAVYENRLTGKLTAGPITWDDARGASREANGKGRKVGVIDLQKFTPLKQPR